MPLLDLEGFSPDLWTFPDFPHSLPRQRIRLAMHDDRTGVVFTDLTTYFVLKNARHPVRLGKIDLGHPFKLGTESP